LRRAFDAPLPATAPDPGATPAAAGSPFVDLGGGRDAGARDECAIATATLASGAGGAGVLGLATDDEVKLYVDGTLAYARSPLRSPPPPFDLADLGKPRPLGPAEARIPVTLAAGTTTLVVQDCRVGEDFGFFVRQIPRE